MIFSNQNPKQRRPCTCIETFVYEILPFHTRSRNVSLFLKIVLHCTSALCLSPHTQKKWIGFKEVKSYFPFRKSFLVTSSLLFL